MKKIVFGALMVALFSTTSFAGVSTLEQAVINQELSVIKEMITFDSSYDDCWYKLDFQQEKVCKKFEKKTLVTKKDSIYKSIIFSTMMGRFDVVDYLSSLVDLNNIKKAYIDEQTLKSLEQSPYNFSDNIKATRDIFEDSSTGSQIGIPYEVALVISSNHKKLAEHLSQGKPSKTDDNIHGDPYFVSDAIGDKVAFEYLVNSNFPIYHIFPTDERAFNYMKLIANSCQIERVVNIHGEIKVVQVDNIKDKNVKTVAASACPKDGLHNKDLLMKLVDNHRYNNSADDFFKYVEYIVEKKIATIEEILDMITSRGIENSDTLFNFLKKYEIKLSLREISSFLHVYEPIENIEILHKYGHKFDELINDDDNEQDDQSGKYNMLMYAAATCQSEKVEKILSYDVDTEKVNRDGLTALELTPDTAAYATQEDCENTRMILQEL